MRRDQVDHILRAAGSATGLTEFVLIGSAAVFAWREIVPPEMALTREVDLFAYDVDSEEAERISESLDGSLGQASQFDETFGVYCDGVGPTSAILPTDWETRSKRYSSPDTDGVEAVVPDPDDIALSKLCAGRPKDMVWLRAAVAHFIVDPSQMRARFERLPSDDRVPSVAILEERLRVLVSV